DAARGHYLAACRGRTGQRYILGGDRVTIPDYFALICRLCRRPQPVARLPRVAMLSLGAGFSLLRAAGVENVPFDYRQVRHLVGKYGWYASAKAVREFGYSWRPVTEAVADYVAWAGSRAGRGTPEPVTLP